MTERTSARPAPLRPPPLKRQRMVRTFPWVLAVRVGCLALEEKGSDGEADSMTLAARRRVRPLLSMVASVLLLAGCGTTPRDAPETRAANDERGQRWAVIIGVEKYDHHSIPPARYAVEDAQAIYQTLAAAGFKQDNMVLLTDRTEQKPTLRNIMWALGTFLGRGVRRGDTVLIYFAGHGGVEADGRGLERDGLSTYLVPRDADPDDLYSTALPMDSLHTVFARLDADMVMAFLDASYAGGAGGRTVAPRHRRGGRAADDAFLERLTRVNGRAIVAAARPNEVSVALPELRHGLFTYYLLEGLRGPADLNRDGIVSLQEVYEYVESRVRAKSRAVGLNQHPMMRGELQGLVPLIRLREP